MWVGIILVDLKVNKLSGGGNIWGQPWLTYSMNSFCRWVSKEAGRKGGCDKPTFQGEEHLHLENWRTERITGRGYQSNASIILHQ